MPDPRSHPICPIWIYLVLIQNYNRDLWTDLNFSWNGGYPTVLLRFYIVGLMRFKNGVSISICI